MRTSPRPAKIAEESILVGCGYFTSRLLYQPSAERITTAMSCLLFTKHVRQYSSQYSIAQFTV
eukprot:scaffold9343_cov189-Ochromonas_danica.AAC.2